MIQHTLMGVQIQVADQANGEKHMVIIDPQSGQVFVLPLDAEAAKQIGAQLSGSSVVVAPAGALNGLKR